MKALRWQRKKIKKDSKNTSDAHGLEELISGKWPCYQEKSTFITVQSKIQGHSSQIKMSKMFMKAQKTKDFESKLK